MAEEPTAEPITPHRWRYDTATFRWRCVDDHPLNGPLETDWCPGCGVTITKETMRAVGFVITVDQSAGVTMPQALVLDALVSEGYGDEPACEP